MYFTTEEILKALREGATDTDLANQFAKSLNEATKTLNEEKAKAKAVEADRLAKETLYSNCANAFTEVLAAEGIDETVTVEDIHAIVDGVKNARAILDKLMDTFSALEDKPKRGHRAEIKPTADNDDDIIKTFLASLS